MCSRLYYSLPCLGLLTAVLSGCSGGSDAPVSIDYSQIGFCNTYATPSGVRASKPNEVFVVYKIDAVDNTKRNADFTFLPARLYVGRATVKQEAGQGMNTAPQVARSGTSKTPWVAESGNMKEWFSRLDSRRFVPNDTTFAQAMGVGAVTATVITRGAKTAINGYSVIAVAKPDTDRPAGQIAFSLNYDPQEGEGWALPADPPVVLNNTNTAQTSWPHPDNCQDLTFDRLAS